MQCKGGLVRASMGSPMSKIKLGSVLQDSSKLFFIVSVICSTSLAAPFNLEGPLLKNCGQILTRTLRPLSELKVSFSRAVTKLDDLVVALATLESEDRIPEQMRRDARMALFQITFYAPLIAIEDTRKTFVRELGVKAIEGFGLVHEASTTVIDFYRMFAGDDTAVLARLVAASLREIRQFGTRVYLDLLGEPWRPHQRTTRHHMQTWFRYALAHLAWSGEDWYLAFFTSSERFSENSILMISDAIQQDWTQIRWSSEQVLLASQELLRRQWSIEAIVRTLGLDVSQIRKVSPNLNFAQLLDVYRISNRLDMASAQTLIGILRNETESMVTWRNTEHARDKDKVSTTPDHPQLGSIHDWRSRIRESLIRVLVDSDVHYDILLFLDTEIFNLLKPNRFATYSNLSLIETDVTIENARLGRRSKARFRQFAAEIRRKSLQPWIEARAFGTIFRKKLTPPKFETAQQFVDFYKLKSLYEIPSDFKSNSNNAELRVVAEEYFRELEAQLPLFLSLNPNASQFRWLLETPLQFPVDLHDDQPWRYAYMSSWKRPFARLVDRLKRPPADLHTRGHIFLLMYQTLDASMKSVRSLDDWLEIVTFEVMPADEYESLHRYVLTEYFDQAVRFGDAEMKWMDHALFANRQGLSMKANAQSRFLLLLKLRESMPEHLRSDARLMGRAVDWLITDRVKTMAHNIAKEDANDPFRKLIIGFAASMTKSNLDEMLDTEWEPDAKTIAWIQRYFEEGLLRYLAARSQAGAKLELDSTDRAALTLIAKAHFYECLDHESGAVQIFKKTN